MALTKPDHRMSKLLGTVSQSGGLPTGAIIERGSNANGDYVKYADGTMLCWGTVTGTPTTGPYSSSWGTQIYYMQGTITLPAAMIGTTYATFGHATARGALSLIGWIKTTAGFTYELVHPVSGSSVTAQWFAVGRWF